MSLDPSTGGMMLMGARCRWARPRRLGSASTLSRRSMPVRWVAEGDVMARGASQSFVGVLVPSQQRSIHAMVAQSVKETEALINRLEARGAGGPTSGRGLIRELYVQARKQREVLAAVLRLELE